MDHDQLQQRREELSEYLEAYVRSCGRIPNSAGLINCIAPHHPDTKASMRLTAPRRNSLWCYGCGAHYDIFDAAAILENKPLIGKSFITDNVNYLSQMFGLPPLTVTLSETDEKELACERAHRMAGALFRSHATYQEAAKRGWKNEGILRELGIGTVKDRDKFFQEVCRDTGMSLDKLRDVGIEQRFFGPDKLTFVLSGPRGNCIGFASRNLRYETELAAGKETQKYLNPSHERNLVYRKNSYVYNIHRARDRSKAPLVIVVEGYADVVALEDHDIRGGVAVGGTAFTEEHAREIIRTGAKDIVIAMDYDAKPGKLRAGQDAMLGVIETMRRFPDVRTRIIDWSNITKEVTPDDDKLDIDSLLAKKGKEYVLDKLTHSVPPIVFKVRELKARGTDQRDLALQVIPDIATIDDELLIQEYVSALAKETDYDFELLLDKVKKERRNRNQDIIVTLDSMCHKFQKDYAKAQDISSKLDLFTALAERGKEYDPRGTTSTLEKDISFLDVVEQEADGLISMPVARTGIECIDEDLAGGIPTNGKLILIGGRPHVGKTQLQQRLLINLLEMNPGVDALVWTLDDDARSWVQRLWAGASGLPIYKCQRPNEYLRHDPRDLARYNTVRSKIRNWIVDGRLEIRDASNGNHVAVLENMVANKLRRSPRPLVVFFDNFHKTVGASNRETLEDTAGRIKYLSQRTGTTIIANAELRKRDSAQAEFPKPPTEDDLKETGKLHYDADYIMLIDSPMQRLPFRPDIINPKTGTPYSSYKDMMNGCWQKKDLNVDLPVLHILRLKNKVFNITGEPEKKFLLNFDPQLVQFYTAKPVPNHVVHSMELDNSTESML